jgi:hypothetical protein
MSSANTYPGLIGLARQAVPETYEEKPSRLFQRIEALIDRAFELAFGDDEKTILNSLRGL